ncbi:GTP-binding protein 1 isoform X5 [Phycodurus eques]|nr:GTP-binding protein 1 isoform X5 [Phycodurus eques]
MESGRTSSVGNDILGFDQAGQVVNKPDSHGGSLDWTKICENSSKVITFIDLAGHEKYLKTTVFGMTGHLPDFCMLMVGSNAGIVGMTKEHLGLALALNVPVFVVVTKIDMCPANILQETLKLLQRLLKSPGCRKIPVLVQNKDDVIVTASNFSSERMCPIFQISNVTGENMDLLKMFLNLLSSRTCYRDDQPAEFQIDDTYSVPGVGTVVSGTTLRGLIRLNDTMLLGPDPLGSFIPIAVKSIHRKRMPVKEVRGGQTASFALKKIKRSTIRKGMVMVSSRLNPQATWEFEAEILVLHHPTTISPRYQAMVHCGSIRQTATILSMNRDCLRTGDKASVHFRFIKTPEYLHCDQRLVFREGRTKAVGTITKLLQSTNNLPSNSKPPQIKMQSTKKTQSRKEDGTTATGDEGMTISQSSGPSTTHVRYRVQKIDKYQTGFCLLSFSCELTLLTASLTCQLFCVLILFLEHLIHPFKLYHTSCVIFSPLCLRGWLPKGRGGGGPSVKGGQQREQAKDGRRWKKKRRPATQRERTEQLCSSSLHFRNRMLN